MPLLTIGGVTVRSKLAYGNVMLAVGPPVPVLPRVKVMLGF